MMGKYLPQFLHWRTGMFFSAQSRREKLIMSRITFGYRIVPQVASLLGHSQPSTTLDIYTHAFDKNKKAASETLQQSLEI